MGARIVVMGTMGGALRKEKGEPYYCSKFVIFEGTKQEVLIPISIANNA